MDSCLGLEKRLFVATVSFGCAMFSMRDLLLSRLLPTAAVVVVYNLCGAQ